MAWVEECTSIREAKGKIPLLTAIAVVTDRISSLREKVFPSESLLYLQKYPIIC